MLEQVLTFECFYFPLLAMGALQLKDVYLGFVKVELSIIEMKNNDALIQAAVEKYPPSMQVDSAFEVPCVYVVSGVEEKKPGMIKEMVWENANSKAFHYNTLKYDDNCKAVIIEGVVFNSNAFIESVEAFRRNNRKMRDAQKQSEVDAAKDKI